MPRPPRKIKKIEKRRNIKAIDKKIVVKYNSNARKPPNYLFSATGQVELVKNAFEVNGLNIFEEAQKAQERYGNNPYIDNRIKAWENEKVIRFLRESILRAIAPRLRERETIFGSKNFEEAVEKLKNEIREPFAEEGKKMLALTDYYNMWHKVNIRLNNIIRELNKLKNTHINNPEKPLIEAITIDALGHLTQEIYGKLDSMFK
ncbi:MAG: hypothetical protein N3D73_02290 [Candidatus Diapherotrites archaeon]|nr:hypothetical protein [Candidatus Diapherotrites archaeon]